MLNQRYNYDAKPILKLNRLQLVMKEQVEQKIKDCTYEFEEVPCPVCDRKNFELLAKKDRYGLYMPVVICKDCGLIQTNPRMSQNAYNEFYNAEYRSLYDGRENPTNEFFLGQYYKGCQIFKYLDAKGLLKARKNMFVLEVGCGAGGILHYFREMGFRVKGIDLGESYIEYGRNHYDLDLSFGAINIIDLDETPDLIIYSHVLEHILTPNDELQKLHNILSDTGILYIEIPGVKNLMHSYKMNFLRLLQNAHVYHFTLRSLKNLLMKNDFRLLIGNETVNSVFKKIQNENSSAQIENDYSDVLAYLHKVERLRNFYPITPYNIKESSKSIVVNILRIFGLFELIRNLYYKIKIS